MQNTWDVQRDYLGLIKECKRCLRPQGEIVFSNNLRHFRIDHQALETLGLSVKDVTAESIPEDFKRNKRIHNCWILTDES